MNPENQPRPPCPKCGRVNRTEAGFVRYYHETHVVRRHITIAPLKDADHTLVAIRNGYPRCIHHGAMNKLTRSGIWRCVSSYRIEGDRLIENACGAGFQEGT